MRLSRKLAFAAAIAAPLATASVTIAAPTVVGVAVAILNSVSIKAAGSQQFGAAKLRQRIALGDQVQTGPASRMQAVLLDKSVFTIGANARLTIDRFVYDPDGGSFAATVAKGAFRFMSSKRHREDTRIDTPVATVGIRGTIVDGVVGAQAIAIAQREKAIGYPADGDPLTASLIVLRGPGANPEGHAAPGAVSVTAAGATVDLDQPLMAAYVPRAGVPPMGPFILSQTGISALGELILPARDRAEPLTAPPSYAPPPRDYDGSPWSPYGYPGYDPGGPPPGYDGPGGGPLFPNLPNPPVTRNPPPTRQPQQQPPTTNVPNRQSQPPATSPNSTGPVRPTGQTLSPPLSSSAAKRGAAVRYSHWAVPRP